MTLIKIKRSTLRSNELYARFDPFWTKSGANLQSTNSAHVFHLKKKKKHLKGSFVTKKYLIMLRTLI